MNTESPPRQATLDLAARRLLRAQAHSLSPVVMVSEGGLTPGVMAEIDRCLAAHGLIKIKVLQDRDKRAALLAEICQRTAAHAVQHIGKVLIIYREKPERKKMSTPSKRR